jgi:hypothetical protein
LENATSVSSKIFSASSVPHYVQLLNICASKISRQFSLPPKLTMVPVSKEGLLCLTLDRKIKDAKWNQKVQKNFSVKMGTILAYCKIVNIPPLVPRSIKRGPSTLEDEDPGNKVEVSERSGKKLKNEKVMDRVTNNQNLDHSKLNEKSKYKLNNEKHSDKKLVDMNLTRDKFIKKMMHDKKQDDMELGCKKVSVQEIHDSLIDRTELNQDTKKLNMISMMKKTAFDNLFDETKNKYNPVTETLPLILVRLHLGQHVFPFALTSLHYMAAVAINPQAETVKKRFIPLPPEGNSRADNQLKIQLSSLIDFFTSLNLDIEGDSLVLVIVSSSLCASDPVNIFENMISSHDLREDYKIAVGETMNISDFLWDMSALTEKGVFLKLGQNQVVVGENYARAGAIIRDCYLGDSWVTPMIKDYLVRSCDPENAVR